MIKVGIFMNHPAHYHDPVFYHMMESDRVHVELIYYEKDAADHTEWRRTIREGSGIYYCRQNYKIIKEERFHPDALRILHRRRYDVVVVSGRMPVTSYVILNWCGLRHIPFIFCADTASMPPDAPIRMSERKQKIYRRIAGRAMGIWVPGRISEMFWAGLCGNEIKSRIIQGRYLLDHEGIVCNRTGPAGRMEMRRELGIEADAYIFLFVGELIPDRKIENLLSAFAITAGQYANAGLLLIGYGEEEYVVEKYKRRLGRKLVHIPKVPYAGLNDYYLAADCYVHPGKEPYSLALVQAAYNNLWMISTRMTGAAYDYIADGMNGTIVTEDDRSSLSGAMLHAIGRGYKKEQIEQMEKLNSRIFNDRSAQKVSEALIEYIEGHYENK